MKTSIVVAIAAAAVLQYVNAQAASAPQSVEEAMRGRNFVQQLQELQELYKVMESINMIKKTILPKAIKLSADSIDTPTRVQKKLCDVRALLAGAEDTSRDETIQMLNVGPLQNTNLSIYLNNQIEGINILSDEVQAFTKDITVDNAIGKEAEIEKLNEVRTRTNNLVNKWTHLTNEIENHIKRTLQTSCVFITEVGQSMVGRDAGSIVGYADDALERVALLHSEVTESAATLEGMRDMAEELEFEHERKLQRQIDGELADLEAASINIEDCTQKLSAIRSVALELQTAMGKLFSCNSRLTPGN